MKIPENTIINGDIFWDSSVLKSLKAAPAGGDIRELYGDAPGSFYDSLVRSAEKYPDRICITDNAGDVLYLQPSSRNDRRFFQSSVPQIRRPPGNANRSAPLQLHWFLRVILRDQQTERRIRAPLDQVPESRSPFPDREGVSERTDTG